MIFLCPARWLQRFMLQLSMLLKQGDSPRPSPEDSGAPPSPPLVAGLYLAKYREYCLAKRTDGDAQRVREIGEELRCLRSAAHLPRNELAALLCCDLELLVAIENGFGDLRHAASVFDRALKLVENRQ
jgi:hypothetical protein